MSIKIGVSIESKLKFYHEKMKTGEEMKDINRQKKK